MAERGKHPNSRNGFKKGRKVSLKERKASSLFNKQNGIKPPSREGTFHSEETKQKMKETHSNRDCSHSDEAKKKIGDFHSGRKFTEEQRDRFKEYWESRKGKKPWNYGMRKDRESNPYPDEFNRELKKLIKDRDKNMCMICKNNKSLCVHHINYDKKDCRPENLVTLCSSCNSKMNFNRPTWELFHVAPQRPTKYNLSIAMLSDRLSIVTLKSIKIPNHKEQYEREAQDIMHDIDLVAKEHGIYFEGFSTFIRATQIDAVVNSMIWANESKARNGEEQDLKLLKLTHSMNRVRNEAMGVIDGVFGGDIDLKSDYMDAKFTKEFGYDFGGIL